MEQRLRADLPVARKRRSRLRKDVPAYLLGLPATGWLLIFFVIPLVTMLSLAVQTCDVATLACNLTWHFGEFGDVLSRYHEYFVRSLIYASIATALDLTIAFPLAYWIAFYGGRRKNFFLLMLLVPFFVSFVIRTIAWQVILSSEGIIFGTLKNVGVLPESFHVLATGIAVIAGMAYNFLPFTALPLYVALERIDRRVVEAAGDLYASRRAVFVKVILPLAIPGIFAAFLLTFVPAAGDFVNASILGGTHNRMIGNIIQDSFFQNSDYPAAAAMSTFLMVGMLIGILAYARALGSRTIEEYV